MPQLLVLGFNTCTTSFIKKREVVLILGGGADIPCYLLTKNKDGLCCQLCGFFLRNEAMHLNKEN